MRSRQAVWAGVVVATIGIAASGCSDGGAADAEGTASTEAAVNNDHKVYRVAGGAMTFRTSPLTKSTFALLRAAIIQGISYANYASLWLSSGKRVYTHMDGKQTIARIDIQNTVASNGRNYQNIQLQMGDHTYATVLINRDTLQSLPAGNEMVQKASKLELISQVAAALIDSLWSATNHGDGNVHPQIYQVEGHYSCSPRTMTNQRKLLASEETNLTNAYVGPIYDQTEANELCNLVANSRESIWTGGWNTVQANGSVCQLNPIFYRSGNFSKAMGKRACASECCAWGLIPDDAHSVEYASDYGSNVSYEKIDCACRDALPSDSGQCPNPNASPMIENTHVITLINPSPKACVTRADGTNLLISREKDEYCDKFAVRDAGAGKKAICLAGTNLCWTERGYREQLSLEPYQGTQAQKFTWNQGSGNDAFIINDWGNGCMDVSTGGCKFMPIGVSIISSNCKWNDACSDNQQFHVE